MNDVSKLIEFAQMCVEEDYTALKACVGACIYAVKGYPDKLTGARLYLDLIDGVQSITLCWKAQGELCFLEINSSMTDSKIIQNRIHETSLRTKYANMADKLINGMGQEMSQVFGKWRDE